MNICRRNTEPLYLLFRRAISRKTPADSSISGENAAKQLDVQPSEQWNVDYAAV